jgi:predicted amidohydrolase
MRDPLTIAVAPPLVVSYDVAANAVTHAETVRAANARVVVFPELSLTGYELDAPAITVDDPRLHPLVHACVATGAVALAGAPVRAKDGMVSIAMIAVGDSGVRVAYRKMWLSTAETRRFSPGGKPAVLDVDGWRLGLAICKDTGIPQHAADTAALGIDGYVAGVLETTEDAAVPDGRARQASYRRGARVGGARRGRSSGVGACGGCAANSSRTISIALSSCGSTPRA